jgi:RNA polymerase sigma-70 factor (ECF subfamily)
MMTIADPDTALMLRVQNNDSESFACLLHRNRNLVVRYIARIVSNQAIAEELSQEVFLRVYRSRQRYRPAAKFSTWLYRISTNVALNYFRDLRGAQPPLSLDEEDGLRIRRQARDRDPLIVDRLVRNSVAEQIRRAIRCLPAKQRAAVIMHKYEEMDYAEIGRVLGCSPTAVKALMFRAYETLRVRLRGLEIHAVPAASLAPKYLTAAARG